MGNRLLRVLRCWRDVVQMATSGRLEQRYILETKTMRVGITINSFLPIRKECPQCCKMFSPIRKGQLYCNERCNVKAQGRKRLARLKEERHAKTQESGQGTPRRYRPNNP